MLKVGVAGWAMVMKEGRWKHTKDEVVTAKTRMNVSSNGAVIVSLDAEGWSSWVGDGDEGR